MYLSKIKMDLRAESVRQSLRDCGDLHRNVQKLFSDSREGAGVLYRLYKDRTSCWLYILSEIKPIETESTLRNGMSVAATKDVSLLEEKFVEGRTLGFNILTLPSKKVSDGFSKNSKRRFLRLREDREAWLVNKGEANGFKVLTVEEMEGETLYSRNKEKPMYIHTTKFTGVLCVTDREKFVQAWRHGIGPEKAYGLGMIMVR